MSGNDSPIQCLSLFFGSVGRKRLKKYRESFRFTMRGSPSLVNGAGDSEIIALWGSCIASLRDWGSGLRAFD